MGLKQFLNEKVNIKFIKASLAVLITVAFIFLLSFSVKIFNSFADPVTPEGLLYSSDEYDYYKNCYTNKGTTTVVDSNVTCFDMSASTTQDNKVYAYLYDDGMLVLDGSGNVLDTDTGFGYSASEYKNKITKAATSINGFAPSRCTSLFYELSNLTSVDLSTLDLQTNNCTLIGLMFCRCSSLTSIDFTGVNTSGVTYMSEMFSGCTSLTNITFGDKFDTSLVYNFNYTFSGTGFKTLDLSGFNTASVQMMRNMFDGCTQLKSVSFGDSFNLSNIKEMQYMFNGCSSLESIDLGVISNTNNLKYIYNIFDGCTSLKKINLSNFSYSNSINLSSYTSLTEIILPKSTNSNSYLPSAPTDAKWYGFDINDQKINTVYTTIPKCIDTNTNGIFESGELYKVKLVYDYLYKDTVNNKKYYVDGYKVNDGDLIENSSPQVFNMSASPSASNTASAYLYGDGTLILDGSGYLNCSMYAGFRSSEYGSLVQRIVISKNGFAPIGSCENLFYGSYFTNLTSIDLSGIDTSEVTSMKSMFENCENMTTLDVSSFNTSKVTNMNSMFCNCGKITTLDVSSFDTSKVTDMHYMFSDVDTITELNVSNFNTSSCTDMSSMFSCDLLESLDVSNFDTSNVTNMQSMFESCQKLETIKFGDKFNASNVSNMIYMFFDCNALKSLDLSSFVTTNVGYYDCMFGGCTSLDELNISSFDFSNSEDNEDYYDIFYNNFDAVSVIDCFPKKIILPSKIPSDLSALKLGIPQSGYSYYVCDINGNNIRKTNYLAVKNDIDEDGTFEDGEPYQILLKETLLYEDSETGTKYYLNRYVENGVDKEAPTVFNIGKTASDDLHAYLYSDGMLILDGEGNTKLTTTRNEFRHSNYSALIKKAAVSYNGFKTNSLAYLFRNLENLKQVDFTYVDTTDVTDMSYMFYECSSLEKLDLSNLDTENVLNMALMFDGCEALASINLSSFNTSNVTSMASMFRDCESLTSLDLSKFNTLKVSNMSSMFSKCKSLKELDLSSFKCAETSLLTDTLQMFTNCDSLEQLNLGNLDLRNITLSDNMFYIQQLKKLKEIVLPKYINETIPVVLPSENNMSWFACDIDGTKITLENGSNTCTSLLSKIDTDADSIYESGELYKIKLFNSVLFKDTTVTPNVEYYVNGASNGATLVNGEPYNISKFGYMPIYAYLYTDGMLILEGEGLTRPSCTWSEHKKDVTRVAISNNGFKPTSMYGYFYDHENLTDIYNMDKLDLSECTSVNSLFSYCTKLKRIDLTPFENNLIEDFYRTFYECKNLEELDVQKIDFSHAKTMQSAFYEVGMNHSVNFDFRNKSFDMLENMQEAFYSGAIGNANYITNISFENASFPKLTNMKQAFIRTLQSNKANTNILNLQGASFPKVENIEEAFMSIHVETLDLSGFDFSNVTDPTKATNALNSSYVKYIKLPQAVGTTPISLYNKRYKWIALDSDMNPIDNGIIYRNLIASTDEIKYLQRVDDILYQEGSTRYYNDGIYPSYEGTLVSSFDLSENQDGTMMAYLYSNGTLIFDGKGYYDEDDEYHANYGDNGSNYFDIKNYSLYNSSNGYSEYASTITRVRFSNNGYKPNNMSYAFFGLYNLTDIDFTNLDTSELKYADYMFAFCTSLTSLNLSSLDFTKLENMNDMFFNCLNLDSIIMGQMVDNTTNAVNSITNAFVGCTKLQSIDLSGMIFNIDNDDGVPYESDDVYPFDANFEEEIIDDYYLYNYCSRIYNPADETSMNAYMPIVQNLVNNKFDLLNEIKLPLIREGSDRIILPTITNEKNGDSWEPCFIDGIEYNENYDKRVYRTINIDGNRDASKSSFMFADENKNCIEQGESPCLRNASPYLTSKNDDLKYMIKDKIIYSDPKQSGKDYYFNGTQGEGVVFNVYSGIGNVYFILYADGTLLLYGNDHIVNVNNVDYESIIYDVSSRLFWLYEKISTVSLINTYPDDGHNPDIKRIVCSENFNTLLGTNSFAGCDDFNDPGMFSPGLPKLERVDFSQGSITHWINLNYAFMNDSALEMVDLSGVDFSAIDTQAEASSFFSMMNGTTARDYIDFNIMMSEESYTESQIIKEITGSDMSFEEFDTWFESNKSSNPSIANKINMVLTVMPNFKEIILPTDGLSDGIEIKLPVVPGKVFYGADCDGNIDYSKTYTKLVKQTSDVYKLVTCKSALYIDDKGTTSFSDDVTYFDDGTNKTEGDDAITLEHEYKLNSAGTQMAYLYSDGMLIFDGTSDATTSYSETNLPWKDETIRNIAISNNGFKPTQMRYLFSNNKGQIYQLDNLDTSETTDMSHLFYGCTGLTSLDLSSFNTSKVEDMEGMFKNCSNLTSLDLSSFNTINVTCMMSTFENCKALTTLILSDSFKTDNVTTMKYLFRDCNALTSLNLNGFNTGNVTNMYGTFSNNFALTELNLSKFDLRNVSSTNILKLGTLSGLTKIKLPLYKHATADVKIPTKSGYVWMGYKDNKPNNIIYTVLPQSSETVDEIRLVVEPCLYEDTTVTPSIKYYKNRTSDDNVTLVKSWDLTDTTSSTPAGSLMAYLYSDGMMIFDGKGNNIRYTSYEPWYNEDVPGISPSIRCNKFITKVAFSNNGFKPTSLNYMFNSLYNCTEFLNMDKLDTSQCKTFVRAFAFYNADDISDNVYKSLNLSHFDFSGITEPTDAFSYMFDNSRKLENIVWPDTMNTSNVTTLDHMFANCRALSSNSINDFIDKLNTTNIVSLDKAFDATPIDNVFNTLLGKIDLSKVSWQGLCAGIYKATYIDLSNSNFTNTTGCIQPTTLLYFMSDTYGVENVILNDDMTIYDFSHVTDYSNCFNTYDKGGHGGSAYNDVDEENVIHKLCYELFDFTSTTNMFQMFRHALSLTKIDFTKFRNLDKTATTLTNTGSLFQECWYLQEIIFPENFKFNKISQWDIYNLSRLRSVNWEDVSLINPINTNTQYVLSGMGKDVLKDQLGVFDFSNFTFCNTPTGGFASNLNAKEIITPTDIASRRIFASVMLNEYCPNDYYALDSNGNTLYRVCAANNAETFANRPSDITDAQKEATVKFVLGNLLYRDDYNNTPSNKNDDRLYYDCGTNDDSITLIKSWDITKVGEAPNGSQAGSLMVYLYSDGTMIFDGEGVNKQYAYSGKLASQEYRPWTNSSTGAYSLDADYGVTIRIVISDNGFKPTNLDSLFANYKGTKFYNFDKLDTSSCTSMDHTFRDNSNLEELDVSNFVIGKENETDTQYVTSMENTFQCGSNDLLEITGLNKLDTSKVTNMTYMFNNASKNNNFTLNLSNFDTSSATTFYGMFGNLNVTSLNLSKFVTTNVTDMNNMFYGMHNITEIDMSNFDTSKVDDFKSMFNGCSSLETVKIKLNDTALTDVSSMFNGCGELETIDLTGSTITGNVFDLSTGSALTKIILPDSVASDTANDSSNPSLPTKTWVKFKSNGDAYNSTLYTTLPAKTEIGDYLGTAIPLSQCTFSACEVEYDGTAKKPDFAGLITFNTTTLVPGTDYTVSDYANNVEAGTATCTITGKGAYTGKKENVSFTIKPKAISVNLGASDYEATLKQQKDYDGTTNAESKSITINGVTYQEEGSDTPVTEIINISLTASYDISDAGDRNMIYHPEVTSVTGGHANKSNYNVSFDNIDGSNNVTLNNYGKINGIEIHYTLSNFTKVYDGNSDITLTITLDDPSGILEGQTIGNEGTDVIIPSAVHGTFDSKNVGSDKSITVDTITLTGDKRGNYYLVPKENVKGSITKKLLTYTLGSLDKTFDGTNTNSNVEVTNLTGIESIDEGKVTISSPITATFISSNVGTYYSEDHASYVADPSNKVSLSEITLSGDESGNYRIEQPTSYSGTISALGLTSDMFKAISDMTYTGSEIKPSLEVSDDYISKLNLTNDIEVTYTDNIDKGEATVTISPKDGGNFENSANVTLHFEILAKDIEVDLANEKYSTLLHQEKTYDGTDAGKDDLSIQADGVTGETLVITLTSTYEDKNVGTKDMKYVPSFSSVTGGRCNTSNYNVTYTNINDGVVTLNDYGTINRKLLTYTLGSLDKEYDGTNTNSNVEVTNLTGIESIDEGKVTISSPITATFISSNVGTYYSEDHTSYVADPSNKVSLSEITLSGTESGDESGNYKIEQPTSYSGKITSMMLSESMFNSISNETYNGLSHTPSITVSDSYTDKLVLDRDVTISYNNNINASVGTSDATVTIKAKDTGNFNGSSDVTLHFTIDPATLEIDLGDNSYKSSLEQTKEYDGTTVAKYDMSVTTDGCNGDKLITTFTNATYDIKNVGTRKIIYTPIFSSVQGDRPYTSNYIVTYKNAVSGDVTLDDYGTITKKEISYTTQTTKVYDGNNTSSTVITLNQSDIISSDIGKVSVVTPVAGTYDDELVGDNKVVTPTNSVLTLEGDESGNYKVNNLSNLTGSITLPGSDRLIVDAIGNVTYNGSSLTPALTIKYDIDGDGTGDILLRSGTDYDAIYSNNINAGTANVSITYKGNYTGTDSKTFTIVPRPVTINLNSFVETCSLIQEKIYDATVNPDADDDAKYITYTDPGVTTSEVLRFDLAGVYDSKNVGTRDIIYTVTFTSVTSPNGLTSNYDITYSNGVTTDGITKVTLADVGTINQKDITRSDYDLTIKTKAYDGNAITTIDNFSLHDGVIFSGDNVTIDDYSSCVVTLSDSKEGTHSISSISPVPTISGTDSDNYNLIFTYADDKGTIAKDILLSEMFETISDVIYKGTAYEIVPTITSSYASKLTSDDYTLSWSNNTDASTTDNKAKVIITAKDGGNYSGSVTLEFTIKQKDITVDLNDNTTYTGSVTQEKVYNAKLNADNKSITTSGVNSEVINIPLKGSYTTKVAGENKEINYVVDESIGMTVTGGEGKISNYNVIINNLTGNYGKITKKNVTYTLVINDKVFDGNNKTTIKSLTINDGVIESNESSVLDDLRFSDYSSSVVTLASSANGTHLVTDINPVPELLGDDKDNYSLDFKWDGITGTITNKVIPEDGSGLTISNTLDDNKVMYTGLEIPIESLGITIKDTATGNTLVLGTDYTLSYTSSDGLSTTDATNVGEDKKVYINGIGDYAGETYTTFTIIPKDITYSDLIMSDKLKTDNTKDLTKYVDGKQNRFIHYGTDELEIYYLHDINGTTTDTSDDYRINFNYSRAFISDSSKAIIPFGDLESSKSLKNIVVNNLSPVTNESNYRFIVSAPNEYMFTNKGYLVDNTAPTIVSLVTDNTMYGKDQTITFTMTLSEEIDAIDNFDDVKLKLNIDNLYNKVATLTNVTYDAENTSSGIENDNITKTILEFSYTIDITEAIHTYHIYPQLEIVEEFVTDISGNELDIAIPSSYNNEIEIDTNGFSIDISHDKTLIDNIFTKDDQIVYTIKINTPNNVATSDSDVKNAIKIYIGDSNYENYVDKSSDYIDKIVKVNDKEYKVTIDTTTLIEEDDTLGKSIKVKVDSETITDNLGNKNSAKENVLKVIRTLEPTLTITYDGKELTRTSDGKMIDSNGNEVLIFNNDKVTITSLVTNAIIKYKDMLNTSSYVDTSSNTLVPKNILEFIVTKTNYEITSIYEFLSTWAKSPEEGNLIFRVKTLSDLVDETNKNISDNKLNDLSNELLNEKNILLLDESDSLSDLTTDEKSMLNEPSHALDISKELARRVKDDDLVNSDSDPSDNKNTIDETNIEKEIKDIIKGLKDRDEFLDDIDPVDISSLDEEDIETLMINYTFQEGWVRTLLDNYPKVIELKEAYNTLIGDNETVSLVSDDDEVTIYGVVNRSSKESIDDLLKLIVRPIVDNPEFDTIKSDLESYLVNPNEKVLQPYDIKLVNITKGNALVQPKEGTSMLVTIELPKEYTNRIIHVYHEHDPISDNKIKVTKYKDKCYVEFYTDSFSNFTLTTDENINSVIISKENEIGGNINPDSKVIINDLVNRGINELQFTISLNKDYKVEIYRDGTKVKELTSSGIYTLDKLDEINANVFIKAKFIKVEPKKDDEDPKKDITTQTITVQVANHIPYINGYGDNTFRPNKDMTRAEFSKVISTISNNFSTYTFDKANVEGYKDVKDNAWYSKYVGYMTKTHLMSGYPDGTFKPNDPITRAEVCKVLSSMFNMPVKDVENIFYNELNGHWYFNSTNKMIKAGYVNGYPDGTFKPNKDVTRAEAVSLINRVKDRAVNKDKNISSTYKNTLNNKYKDVKESNWFYNDLLEASVAHSSFDLH